MKLKLAWSVLLIVPLTLIACAKKSDTSISQDGQATASTQETTTPEQQAAIDALDKPVLDEKNTDIPESVSNATVDLATPATKTNAASVEHK